MEVGCRYEKVLLAAMKYALSLEEGDTVEAVIFTLKPRIPYLSDDVLWKMLTAVEMYVKRGKQYDFGEAFLPEWSDVMVWILQERNRRIEAKKEVEAEMEGS